MLLVTKKKIKIALKNFYTLIHFTQWKGTLVNCELSTVSQDLYWYIDLRFYVHYVSTSEFLLISV